MLTLRLALVSQKDTTPSIHDTLTEGDDVVDGVKRHIVAGGHGRGLVEDSCNNLKIGVKLSADSLSDISKCLKDSRLELIAAGLRRQLVGRSQNCQDC